MRRSRNGRNTIALVLSLSLLPAPGSPQPPFPRVPGGGLPPLPDSSSGRPQYELGSFAGTTVPPFDPNSPFNIPGYAAYVDEVLAQLGEGIDAPPEEGRNVSNPEEVPAIPAQALEDAAREFAVREFGPEAAHWDVSMSEDGQVTLQKGRRRVVSRTLVNEDGSHSIDTEAFIREQNGDVTHVTIRKGTRLEYTSQDTEDEPSATVPATPGAVTAAAPPKAVPAKAATPARAIRVRRPDQVYTGPVDSFLQGDAFQVEVYSPGSGPAIEIEFLTGDGEKRTLTLYETGPGTGTYLSQPITAADGAQKTGSVGKRLPGGLSRAMDGFGAEDGEPITVSFGGMSTGFRVYDTNVTQEIGRYKLAFDAMRRQLTDARVAAKTLLKRPGLTQDAINKLNDVVRIADAKLKILDEMDNRIRNPPARQGVGDYSGTLWWELGLRIGYSDILVYPDPDQIPREAIPDAFERGSNIATLYRREAGRFLVKSLAIGFYSGIMTGYMIAPVYTTVTGKNIFGEQATPEEIEAAATNLIATVIGSRVMPRILDRTVGHVAQELSGMGTRASTPLAAGVGPAGRTATRAGQTTGGRTTGSAAAADPPPAAPAVRDRNYRHPGYQNRNLPEGPPDPRVLDARAESGIRHIRARGELAKSRGVDPARVDAIVNEAVEGTRNAAGNATLEAEILGDADFDLAQEIFQVDTRGGLLIDHTAMPRSPTSPLSDPVSSVRAKAALEVAGKPQRWTPQEVYILRQVASDPRLQTAFTYESPLISEDPGYSPIFTEEDVSNIVKVSRRPVTIAPEAPAVRAARPPSAPPPPPPGNAPAAPARASAPTSPAKPPLSNRPPAAKPLQPTFDPAQLRAEILKKRQASAARAQRAREAPVSGTREASTRRHMETQVLKPEGMKVLTAEEIGRLTPEDIKALPAEFRDRLPLGQLSRAQLRALAESGTVLTNERIQGLTPETIKRLPPELRDLLPLERLEQGQLRAVADTTGAPTLSEIADTIRAGLQRGTTPAELMRIHKPDLERSGVTPAELQGELEPVPRRVSLGSLGASDEVRVAFTSLGKSSGEAFRLQVVNNTSAPVRIDPGVVVLEPVKSGPAPPALAVSGGNAVTVPLEAYCMEFARPVPSAGMSYRLAPPAVQQAFQPLGLVVRAGERLEAGGALHPDSNPQSYGEFIVQYTLWTVLEGWDERGFTEAFVRKTKENFAAVGRKWDGKTERILRDAAPGRWRDVQSVLMEANNVKAS